MTVKITLVHCHGCEVHDSDNTNAGILLAGYVACADLHIWYTNDLLSQSTYTDLVSQRYASGVQAMLYCRIPTHWLCYAASRVSGYASLLCWSAVCG